ncbi:unnamed protein product [Didymodactylos carnosus]|uniref:Peroxidase n=1 Tax=Didymodactylos carnosus TaxID=1234261 RepID=A0A813XGR8_9BILA|nr:unnamed protein product [Didymodactylos carnosus]CAF0872929.1 unnamed protein product [Didymodactylos carnosus]CAF3653563.1 unnamed protein product [Didymodactylos carnosus]CAF3660124.1 unnamed protein product [Didymodactylos carnosus]
MKCQVAFILFALYYLGLFYSSEQIEFREIQDELDKEWASKSHNKLHGKPQEHRRRYPFGKEQNPHAHVHSRKRLGCFAEFPATSVNIQDIIGAQVAQILDDETLSDDAREHVIAEIALGVSSALLSKKHFLQEFEFPKELCSFRPEPVCDRQAKYREISGICNNLDRPYDGSAGTTYSRILEPDYDDGIGQRRSKSKAGGLLPSARECSLKLFTNTTRFSQLFTNYFVIFGQFMVHDATFAGPGNDKNGKQISCTCNSVDSDGCVNIAIPPNDPFMSDQKCMAIPIVAEGFPNHACSLGVREQKNANTHHLDMSVVYGSSKALSDNLREHNDGLLRTTNVKPLQEYLPTLDNGKSCGDGDPTVKCFIAGDGRVLENLVLTSITTQWVRFHNQLARTLKKLHADWSDDTLFEEAKKINVAVYQSQVYNDYLRVLLGKTLWKKHFSNDKPVRYDPKKSASVWTEFASAAMRCHTFVRSFYSRATRDYQFIDQKSLKEISGRATIAWDLANGGLDAIMRGAVCDFGSSWDLSFSDDIRHHLFESTGNFSTKRFDLTSMNINRARAQGMRGYNSYREWCGLKRAETFEDFDDSIDDDRIQQLKDTYAYVYCQLKAIEKYSHRSFMCDTIETDTMQADPYRPRSIDGNSASSCKKNTPGFDFSAWK